MSGQAVVTIRDKRWNVSLANTLAELAAGLSGIESILPWTGVLFDLGYDRSFIQIDMTGMLFPLDIIFINSTRGVLGVMRDVQPGETDVRFEATITPGARCFLEVNAGEAEGIEIGDNVAIQGYVQPAQFNVNTLVNFMFIAMILVMMMKVVGKALEEPKERPVLYGPRGERLLLQTTKKLTAKWFDKGVAAGKTDGWMDVENTIKETAQTYPEIKDAHDLVWTDIDLWEQTDHFNILYGSKMWEDAKGDIDLYSDLKSEFWEGYLSGRKEIGRDVYQIAKELVRVPSVEFLPQTVGKRGKVLYKVSLTYPKHIEEVVLEDDTAVVKRFGRELIRFRPGEEQRRRIKAGKGFITIFTGQVTEETMKQLGFLPELAKVPPPGYAEWKAKLEAGYGQYRPGVSEAQVEQEAKSIPKDALHYYFREKIGFLPLTYQEIAEFRKRTGKMPRGVMPKLPEEARGDLLFFEYIRDLVKWGEVISDEEARVRWEAWAKRKKTWEQITGKAPTASLPPSAAEYPPHTGGKVYFIGACKVSEGLCLTHGYSVSETGKCPDSPLTDEEWKATFELVKTAFPEGQPNPWVNGWWPETWEEVERAVRRYADSLWDAFRKYEAMAREAIGRYRRSAEKAIHYYRRYVMREYERGKELRKKPRIEALSETKPAVSPIEKRPRREGDLEYLADSPEFLTQTIEAIGYRDKLDTAFQEAIARAKGLK